MRIAACALPLLLVAGCKPPAPEPPPPPSTPVVLTDIRPGTPLDDMLVQLEQALAQAWTGQMEGSAASHLVRAEAITDRLLEASLPFEWLTTEQYSLSARLRQIQSEADRVIAEWQTGTPSEDMLRDLRQLRTEVVRLRQAIARGGGRAPPALQQLLTDTVRRAAPAPAPAAPPAQTPPTVPPDTGFVRRP